ncbi:MAG: hypothetical protein LBS86_05840 [Treponema sp.]|jgi:hypothetical protein|nr:hypothetical protein [Treponema sp.]
MIVTHQIKPYEADDFLKITIETISSEADSIATEMIRQQIKARRPSPTRGIDDRALRR